MPAVRDSRTPEASSPPPVPYRSELIRKALHVATALTVPLLMLHLPTGAARLLLAAGAALGVGADVLRAFAPGFNTFIRRIFGPIMRADELPPAGGGLSFNGATCVLVGALLLGLLVPMPLAAAVLAAVLVADAAAALVGRRWGAHHWPGTTHTVEGSVAFIVAGTLVWKLAAGAPVHLGTIGLTAAAVVEALPLPINDNISVPLAAAGVLTLLGVGG
jgi:dolichol kinase